jgi:hypothetical protein
MFGIGYSQTVSAERRVEGKKNDPMSEASLPTYRNYHKIRKAHNCRENIFDRVVQKSGGIRSGNLVSKLQRSGWNQALHRWEAGRKITITKNAEIF